jgi:hypothetical protein
MSPVSSFVPHDGLRQPMLERDCGELVAELDRAGTAGGK